MSKIKTIKAFKEGVDAAFETLKTRDEAKACYDYARARKSEVGGTAESRAALRGNSRGARPPAYAG